MEVRAAASRAGEGVVPTVVEPRPGAGAAAEPVAVAAPAPVVAAPTRQRAGSGRRVATQVAARPMALTRFQEYRYIRADLRRLLFTAGLLLLLLIVLLLVLEL